MLRNAHVPTWFVAMLAVGTAAGGAAGPLAAADRPPSVLLITVDTLRTDRLSTYGYERPTSPHIDDLLSRGTKFTHARTIEPLTNPALASMVRFRLGRPSEYEIAIRHLAAYGVDIEPLHQTAAGSLSRLPELAMLSHAPV